MSAHPDRLIDYLYYLIRPYLSQYAHAPNRLAVGEQTVIVMSSRVAQKSYGNEKRYVHHLT